MNKRPVRVFLSFEFDKDNDLHRTNAAVSISKLIGVLGTSDKNLEERTKLQSQKSNIEVVIGEFAVKLEAVKQEETE